MNTAPKLCITTNFDLDFAGAGKLGNLCITSIKKYAAKYGYDTRFFTNIYSGRPSSWNKILVIKKLLQEYDFVLWVDADAIFVRFDKKITDEIEPDKDIYLIDPQYNLNAGVLLVKNTSWSLGILDKLWNMRHYENHSWWEQAAFAELFGLIDNLPAKGKRAFGNAICRSNYGAESLQKIKCLNPEWNKCSIRMISVRRPIIYHCAGRPFPEKLMRLATKAIRTKLITIQSWIVMMLIGAHRLIKYIYEKLSRSFNRYIKSLALTPLSLFCYWLDRPVITRECLPSLLKIMKLRGEGAEIGVGQGFFSEKIINYSKLSLLYSIDSWQKFDNSDYHDMFNVSQKTHDRHRHAAQERLKKYRAKSWILHMTSKEAAGLVKPESLDFVYIDANHSYEHCKEDIRLWWPKVKRGGVFAGHDYLNGDLPEGRFGVKRAVDEFISETGQKLFITSLDNFPSWYLIKK